MTDYYRTAKPAVNIDEVFNLASQQDVMADTQNKIALDKVANYLKTLSAETRELLIMRLWQGLSFAEMAEITGKSEGALKMAVSRALKQLKASLPPALILILLMNLV